MVPRATILGWSAREQGTCCVDVSLRRRQPVAVTESAPIPRARSLRIAFACAAFTCVTGLVVLFGWSIGSSVLIRVRDVWTPIVPMTAVAFCLAGGSLASIALAMASGRGEASARRWRLVAAACAGVVALIGARRAIYYATGWPTSLDMLGFVPPDGPGQMAFLTAIGFTLAGGSLLVTSGAAFRRSAQWLAALVFLLGWTSLTRFLSGGDLDSPFFRVAVHTALLFGVLGLGLFFARPDGGLMDLWNGTTPGSLLVRRLFPTALLMPIVVGWLRLCGERAGWYGLETGLTLFAMTNVAIFVALTWHTASMLHRQSLARRAAEATRRAEQEFSDALIDSMPGVFYLYDQEGRFRRWNRNFELETRYSAAEIRGLHPRDFFDPADHERLTARIAEVFATGKSELEADFVAKDGTRRPYYFTGIALQTGGETCLCGVGIDISSRREAEDRVRELNADLERRVVQRTAELEAKHRELETFTYSVSHDLKAPLRGIDGYSRLLLEDHAEQLDEEGKRFLQMVRQASGNMAQLIDDLLAYSRLERREVRPSRQPLAPLLTELLAPYQESLQQRGAEVRVSVGDLAVWADATGLAQALRNLIDNAIKFSRTAAHPVIEIGARAAGDRCILHVRDNGVGFDMKFVDRIFDIFQRLHRAEDYPGTGIGLAIVRKAMERLGGRAWAESSPGHGAVFHLDLPISP
jgi:PAS domain S-box-containing protein